MEATVQEARTKLVERALAGEELILTRSGKRIPTAELVPGARRVPAGEVHPLPAFKNGKLPGGIDKLIP
jgi:antitoxin (DNA-binding transcriptional repressor) of toxin-antitoxin stability system